MTRAAPSKTAAKRPAASKAKPAAAPTPRAAKTAAPKPTPAKAAKPAATPAAKAVEKPAAKPVSTAKPEPALKDKPKKPKLVRDSFTMPEAEYQVLGEVKKACLKAGLEVKKSELLRVGVAMISQMDIAQLRQVLDMLPPLKPGRPKKEKQ